MVHLKSFILVHFYARIVHGNNDGVQWKAFTIKLYRKLVCVCVCACVLPFSKINVQMLSVSELDSVAKDVKLIKDCITHRMLFCCNGMHTHTPCAYWHIKHIPNIRHHSSYIDCRCSKQTFFIDMFDHRNLFAFAIHGAEEEKTHRKIIHSISA